MTDDCMTIFADDVYVAILQMTYAFMPIFADDCMTILQMQKNTNCTPSLWGRKRE
jgi:hypothetical protein